MRTVEDVVRELAEVRERRRAVMPIQAEPFTAGSPEPGGFSAGEPGAEITALLEREAQLVIERAELTRSSGREVEPDLAEEEAAARRTLTGIAERRPGTEDD